jgi:rubredoxin
LALGCSLIARDRKEADDEVVGVPGDHLLLVPAPNTLSESEADMIACPVCKHEQTDVIETTPLYHEVPSVAKGFAREQFATVHTHRCLSVRCGHIFRQEVGEPIGGKVSV